MRNTTRVIPKNKKVPKSGSLTVFMFRVIPFLMNLKGVSTLTCWLIPSWAGLVLLAIYTSCSTFADYQLETQGTQSDDAKWNYFREDYLLQGFHQMWHHHYLNVLKSPRRAELFQYVHQQILRRYYLVFHRIPKGSFYLYIHCWCII